MPSGGILWVSSRIHAPDTLPPSVPALTPEAFCEWYEDQHIQEVTALSGVPRAARYEALEEQPDASKWDTEASTWSAEAPWLTIYEMPDIDFRQSEEFKSLDGQSKPKGDLLESVFKQARFDTRFYQEKPFHSRTFKKGPEGRLCPSEDGAGPAEPAKFLVSYASANTTFGAPGHESRLATFVEGLVRMRCVYKVNATTLDRFERVEADVPPFLVLFELESEEAVKALTEVFKDFYNDRALGHGYALETLHSRKVEVGFYRLKRVYAQEPAK